MRFSWIRAEWEDHYIRRVKETILKLVSLLQFQLSAFLSYDSQMHQYHSQKSSISEATTDSPLRDDPVSPLKIAPTRFKVQDSVYRKRSTRNTFSVDAEFQKYISGSISSEETNILRFWEVMTFL